MRAKDVMTEDVLVVGPEDSIEKAAKILLENKISGIPVVDADQRILGIISEQDLMIRAGEFKVPFYITLFDSIIFLENPLRTSKYIKKYTASRVEEAMTSKVEVVDENEEISTIVQIMQEKKINRVPVVRHGKLVGIVTRNDILKSLVKNRG